MLSALLLAYLFRSPAWIERAVGHYHPRPFVASYRGMPGEVWDWQPVPVLVLVFDKRNAKAVLRSLELASRRQPQIKFEEGSMPSGPPGYGGELMCGFGPHPDCLGHEFLKNEPSCVYMFGAAAHDELEWMLQPNRKAPDPACLLMVRIARESEVLRRQLP